MTCVNVLFRVLNSSTDNLKNLGFFTNGTLLTIFIDNLLQQLYFSYNFTLY